MSPPSSPIPSPDLSDARGLRSVTTPPMMLALLLLLPLALGSTTLSSCPQGKFASAFGTCPSYAVRFEGYCYASMDKKPAQWTLYACQSSYIAMPDGWELVPYSAAVVINVVKTHVFGTQCLVFEDGRTASQVGPVMAEQATEHVVKRDTFAKVAPTRRAAPATHMETEKGRPRKRTRVTLVKKAAFNLPGVSRLAIRRVRWASSERSTEARPLMRARSAPSV